MRFKLWLHLPELFWSQKLTKDPGQKRIVPMGRIELKTERKNNLVVLTSVEHKEIKCFSPFQAFANKIPTQNATFMSTADVTAYSMLSVIECVNTLIKQHQFVNVLNDRSNFENTVYFWE